MAEGATGIPPFIPGILIVGLLVFISFIIGWRNYVVRTYSAVIPLAGPDANTWMVWTNMPSNVGDGRLVSWREKPKLWEVNLAEKEQRLDGAEGWEHIMPLSAAPLDDESSASPSASPHPSATRTSFLPSWSSHKASSPPPHPPHQLQVSVLISMPSSRNSRCHQLPNIDTNSKDPRSSSPLAEISTSSDVRKEKSSVSADESSSNPEVVFGVVVLPWHREGGGDGSDAPT